MSEPQQLSRQLDVVLEKLNRLDAKLTALTADTSVISAKLVALLTLTQTGNVIMANFKTVFTDAMAALEAQVAANTSAENSAVTVITELADLITSNAGDPTAVTALAAQLKASADALAAAVVANTPAAPTPAPAPAQHRG